MNKNNENKSIFSKSDNFKDEYCCSIVEVGEMKPIEGSDFLGQTFVNGNSIVVRKDQVKQGDVFIYAANETQLSLQFLAKNNLFEIGARDLNANYKEVEALVQEGKKDEAKRKVGFFTKHGRVKMIRLRGVPSMGFLFGKDALEKYCPTVADIDLAQYVGEDFDLVDGREFVKAYVPYIRPARKRDRYAKKDKRNVKLFNRLIEGEFKLHYETQQLQKYIGCIRPIDVLTISVKFHGTSDIMGNVLTRIPINLSDGVKFVNKAIDKRIAKMRKAKKGVTRYHEKNELKRKIALYKHSIKPDARIGYGDIYSSRTVIKNKSINVKVTSGFYDTDIWGEYNALLKKYIPEDMTVYSEICGYLTGDQKMIQRDYDYGCEVGENFIMPYRITTKEADGKKREWNVQEVYDWTVNLMKEHEELRKKIRPIEILYHGTLAQLYPNIPLGEHWHESVLDAMRNDRKHFGMEQNEPLCKHKVPREGICVRKDDDEIAECWKLKTMAFLGKEAEEITKGVVDIEMANNDY